MLFNDAKALKGHLSLLVADDKYLRSQVEVKYPKSDRIDALLKIEIRQSSQLFSRDK